MGAVALFICTFCSSFAGFAFTLDSEAGGGYDHHAVDLIWPRDGNEAMVVLWASTVKKPADQTAIIKTYAISERSLISHAHSADNVRRGCRLRSDDSDQHRHVPGDTKKEEPYDPEDALRAAADEQNPDH